MSKPSLPTLVALTLVGAVAAPVIAQDSAELAKQLANPIAALISVPFQLNYDHDIGIADEGERWTLNIQPVVPVDLNDRWNMISRTILPVVSQDDIFPGAGSQTGIGDVVQSLFFSPKSTVGGWILGVGPVFLLPTGSNDLLTADQWGAGPTFVGLKQSGQLTFGALVNHVESIAGSDDRPDVSATFLQPFVSYTTPKATTFSLSTESTYDWSSDQFSVPIAVGLSKVLKLGSQIVSVGGNLRYWVDGPDAGAEGLSGRLTLTLLFPRG